MGVAETAGQLAMTNGVDPERARIAGLLHDYAREIAPARLLLLAADYGLEVDAIEAREPLLLHGKVGAALAREEFGIKDAEILEAIINHITGTPGMTMLQQLIFLADFIEPGRLFPAAARARDAAKSDIPGALLIVFDAVITYVVLGGYLLHPRTVAARNDLLLRVACSMDGV